MSFASDQVARLETLMAANPGAQQVTIDGQTVNFRDVRADWEFWKGRVAKEGGNRRTKQIKLG